jgi:ComF family protein
LSISGSIVAALLPQQCLLCGADEDTDGERHGEFAVCQDCAADLPLLAGHCCPCCALPVPESESATAICGQCLKSPPHFDATQAAYRYGFPTDKLIQALKYHRRLASADFLADALLALPMAGQPYQTPDVILPVPLSAQRLAERGFNQAVELARPLARRLNRPLELIAVRRNRHTTPQAQLPWKARAKNIQHAFECDVDLTDKIIWVVDDVMTTGATLNELARVLKLHGARRVENRVVARAVKHGP